MIVKTFTALHNYNLIIILKIKEFHVAQLNKEIQNYDFKFPMGLLIYFYVVFKSMDAVNRNWELFL